uniref:Serine carboxypeptidase-like n=1 Tax=Oryza meridionalis TaxID=40149 RepID=A0A0E0F585_9ORYZ
MSPIPKFVSMDRKILKEELGILKHRPPRPSILCVSFSNYLSYFWANDNVTREYLGIKKGSVDEWVRCHDNDLPYTKDIKSSIRYHHNVTLNGYRALVYSGDHDTVLPFLGTQTWVRSLDYPIVDDWRAWHVDGRSAGFTVAYGNNLTFATVKGGGHTSPEYQPGRCSAMFRRWISNMPLHGSLAVLCHGGGAAAFVGDGAWLPRRASASARGDGGEPGGAARGSVMAWRWRCGNGWRWPELGKRERGSGARGRRLWPWSSPATVAQEGDGDVHSAEPAVMASTTWRLDAAAPSSSPVEHRQNRALPMSSPWSTPAGRRPCLTVSSFNATMALLLPLIVICIVSGVTADANADAPMTRTHVASLPGFNGALPSRLETGYVTVDEVNGGELFYYFIESEGDPGSDPVLLWLTGGDRCSVLSALFFEIGPVKLVIEPYNGGLPRLRYHPYSWTKVANILFVDSAMGAGFSFSRDPNGYDVSEWFDGHTEYLANPFYVGGDSIADIEAAVRPTLNLKGYLVGNPVTGENIDNKSKVPYFHGVGIISDQLYKMILEHCKGEDYDKPKNLICRQAMARFNEVQLGFLFILVLWEKFYP